MIEKVWFSPYHLKGSWNRKGALIRIQHQGVYGYADLHPWPELGDEPLNQQLLKFGRTSLTCQVLKHATLDAESRAKGLNLLQGLDIPKSHYLVTNPYFPTDWECYKLKIKDLHLLKLIPKKAKVRIDCNGTLSLKEAELFLKKLDPHRVEFVEDPTPYSDEGWQQLRKYGIPLAGDRYKGTRADIEIIKPDCDRIDLQAPIKKSVVVTSYLGHALGQAIAAFYAGIMNQKISVRTCGLLSHHAYELNTYSRCLSQNGPYFKMPEGTGFGFDELLQQEEWHALRFHYP